MRFDHERIPERVEHARGSGAHGYFQVYESLAEYTTAGFLTDPSAQTPVFVRFSTVQGPHGSADTVRDVRGFATRFYTRQGNYDLVGNNFPVFFIQDGIKFPDVIHAVKMEPHNEIPMGASAHDTFYDFVSLQPETLHTVMWLMSDRAIPRSYATMQASAYTPSGSSTRRAAPPSSSSTGHPWWACTRWSGTRRGRSPARTPTSTGGTCGSGSSPASSRVRTRRAAHPRKRRRPVRLRPARPDQDRAGGAGAGDAGRAAGAQPRRRSRRPGTGTR
jgi:hypothetical protein